MSDVPVAEYIEALEVQRNREASNAAMAIARSAAKDKTISGLEAKLKEANAALVLANSVKVQDENELLRKRIAELEGRKGE